MIVKARALTFWATTHPNSLDDLFPRHFDYSRLSNFCCSQCAEKFLSQDCVLNPPIMAKGVRAAKGDPSGNTPASHKTPSTLLHKNIPLYRNSESQYQSAIPIQGEGRSSVVTNVDRGVVDAAASGTKTGPGRDEPREVLSSARTNGACVRRSLLAKPDRCVRQNRVVLAVVATVKPCGDGSRLNRVFVHRQFASRR